MANAGTSSAVGRDVVYTISFQVDPAVRTATEQLAKSAEETFSRIGRSQKKASTDAKVSLDDEIKTLDAKFKKFDEVQKAQDVANTKMRAAQNAITAASKNALEGVAQLGRGITLLGVVAEKDMEKAVRTFAKFEAGVNVIKGLTNIIDSGRKAWEAYRVAAEAAAAASAVRGTAEAAAGATGGLASAAGAAAAGGPSSIAIAALIAAIAAAGWSVVEAFKGVAHEADSFTGTIRGIIKAIPGGTSVLRHATERSRQRGVSGVIGDIQNITMLGPIGAIAAASDVDDSNAAVSAAQRNFVARQRQQQADEALAATLAATGQSNAQALAANRLNALGFTANRTTAGALATVRNQMGFLGSQEGQAGFGAAGALERQLGLRQKELDLVRQIGQEQKATAEQNIRALENQLAKQQAIAQAAESRLTSAAERFADLSPVEQQRTIQAQQRLRAGEQLSREDRRRLRNLGLSGPNAAVQAQDVADANRAGFGKFFGAEERAEANRARQEEQRIAVQIKREKDFIVKVEADTELQASLLAVAVAVEMARLDAELRKEFEAKLQRIRDQDYERRAREAQTAYAVGGGQ